MLRASRVRQFKPGLSQQDQVKLLEHRAGGKPVVSQERQVKLPAHSKRQDSSELGTSGQAASTPRKKSRCLFCPWQADGKVRRKCPKCYQRTCLPRPHANSLVYPSCVCSRGQCWACQIIIMGSENVFMFWGFFFWFFLFSFTDCDVDLINFAVWGLSDSYNYPNLITTACVGFISEPTWSDKRSLSLSLSSMRFMGIR